MSDDKLPKQVRYAGSRVEVLLYGDLTTLLLGTLTREDIEAPFIGRITLDDGRVIETTDCIWRPRV